MAASGTRQIVLEPLAFSAEEVSALSERLLHLSKPYGIELDPRQSDLCVRYLLYILQINSFINLTSIRSVDDALVLHLLDSLLFISCLPKDAQSFVDMGTGGGFPGVPVSIATDMDGVLVDSVAKKLNAIDTVAAQLNLRGISTVHARLEDYATSHAGVFDVAFARALAPMPTLVEYAAPFLSLGGRLVLSKGQPDSGEVRAGFKAAMLCGLECVEELQFELPDGYGSRQVFAFQKVAEPSIRLPRAVGLAKKSPLA